MEKKCQKYNIIQMLKSTLFSHIFKKMFLSKFTLKNIPKALHFLKKNGTPPPPPPPSVPSLRRLTSFIIPQKNILATFIDSLLVYISQMYLQV